MAWKMTRNDFPSMAAQLQSDLETAVDNTAQTVARLAVANAPVRSGALRGSIYALTPRRDGYAAAVARVLEAAPRHADQFESSGADSGAVYGHVLLTRASGRARARVLVAVTYGLWVEYGSHNGKSNTAARHFLSRARDAAYSAFVVEVSHAVKQLERGKSGRAPRQLTQEQAQAREEGELRALRNSIERQTSRDKTDFLGARLPDSEFARQRNALGNKASGAGYWEDFNERNERLNQRFEELKQEFSTNSDYWG